MVRHGRLRNSQTARDVRARAAEREESPDFLAGLDRYQNVLDKNVPDNHLVRAAIQGWLRRALQTPTVVADRRVCEAQAPSHLGDGESVGEQCGNPNASVRHEHMFASGPDRIEVGTARLRCESVLFCA